MPEKQGVVTPSKKKFKGGKQATQKRKPGNVKAPAVVVPKSFIPAFLYISKCCEALGKKEPLVRSEKDKQENKKSENHMGKFRCSKCNTRSKFGRIKNKDGVSITL